MQEPDVGLDPGTLVPPWAAGRAHPLGRPGVPVTCVLRPFPLGSCVTRGGSPHTSQLRLSPGEKATLTDCSR